MESTAVKDYRACLEGIALLGERDLDGAVADDLTALDPTHTLVTV